MKMKQKIISIALLVLLVCGLFAGCNNNNSNNNNDANNNQQTEQTELLISAAASMTDVLQEIKQNYEAEHKDVKLTYTFGGSGALQTQIEEGAPVDIFMSAAQKQMTALEEKGKIISDTKKTLLVNKVVLIKPKGSDLAITDFASLTDASVGKIALGDPASVPVGQYSEEIFTSLDILDEMKAKAVYASDVRTVLTWVESGEVDCGIVYATDAASSDNIDIICEAPEGSHTLVTYPVAVIEGSQKVDQAKAFLDYLSTDEAKTVFEKYGFAMN